jgi:hypothetical protein
MDISTDPLKAKAPHPDEAIEPFGCLVVQSASLPVGVGAQIQGVLGSHSFSRTRDLLSSTTCELSATVVSQRGFTLEAKTEERRSLDKNQRRERDEGQRRD